MKAIEVNNLVKRYGSVEALRGVEFEVEQGELFGIIGPDGAGKSTLFRILTTLLLPNGGQARVDGFDTVRDYKQIRRRVGYMPGRFSLYQDLSVEENLTFFASIFGTSIAENYHLIADIYRQIEPFKTRKAGKLSGGMKQKLALCCALIHSPSVLFLDEPTTGVDPVSRKEFWQMLQRLKAGGITIVVSTPYMDEAVQCDRIALMRDGRFLDVATPQHIVEGFKKPLWALSADSMYELLLLARQYPDTESCYAFGDVHHLTLSSESSDIEALRLFLSSHGAQNIVIRQIRANIEDCYMQLSGGK